jgi:hypothetical protein
MPWTAVPDAKTALRIVNAAGKPANAGILVDALHVGRSSTTLDDIRAIPRELLHYAQICDAEAGQHFNTEQMIQTARCERRLPGEGSIDLTGIFNALPAGERRDCAFCPHGEMGPNRLGAAVPGCMPGIFQALLSLEVGFANLFTPEVELRHSI